MNALLNYASNTNAGAAGTFSQVGANAQHQQLFDKVLLFEPMQLLTPLSQTHLADALLMKTFLKLVQ